MSVTQFAMVEELAFLVKDNLHCKHLVLSMEEALLNFLQDDTCSDRVLELQPMDPYNRLLLHRLADIFGFAHVSVGEGDNRHLILERCPETSIPSILVSDILFQYDEPQPLMTSHKLLRRKDAAPVLQENLPSPHTLEEREAAYLAARERIFSLDVGEMRKPVNPRPRNVPVVARRMIAHALGQKTSQWNQDVAVRDCKGYIVQTDELNVQDKDKIYPNSSSETFDGRSSPPCKNFTSSVKVKRNDRKYGASPHGQRNLPQELGERSSTNISISQKNRTTKSAKEYSKEEHMGAAKRMFAHALGLQSARGGILAKNNETKT